MLAPSPFPEAAAVLVDSHVHFHAAYDEDRFLDAALANFRRGAVELGVPEDTPGCLMLAECSGQDWFRRLRERAREESGSWRFAHTAEEASLAAIRGEERAFLVAGRQVATREGIEVLALATARSFPDGLPLGETLARVRASGAVAVLPWGFGKWWLGRGAAVGALLAGPEAAGLFLGDSATRPRLGPRPRLFRAAASRGIPVLAGTDPLPFREHAARAGAHGFLLAGRFDESRPAASLRRLLAGLAAPPPAYGRREGLLRFCRDQAAMQAAKRRLRAASG